MTIATQIDDEKAADVRIGSLPKKLTNEKAIRSSIVAKAVKLTKLRDELDEGYPYKDPKVREAKKAAVAAALQALEWATQDLMDLHEARAKKGRRKARRAKKAKRQVVVARTPWNVGGNQ